MGSYTKLRGSFTLQSKIDSATLKKVCTCVSVYPEFLKEGSSFLKTPKMQKVFKDKYLRFQDEWKNVDESVTLNTVKDFVVAFAKHGFMVQSAAMSCIDEDGYQWKVDLIDNVITLSIGEIVFKPTKVVKLEVVEQITKTAVINFV